MIKRWLPQLASLGAPLLVVMAVVAAQHREGRERVQALPPLLVGSGLIIATAVGRRRHRGHLLEALRSSRQEGS